jgi:hypothetical protein
MKKNNYKLLTGILVAVLAGVNAASAQTFTWSVASGNWSNQFNWSPTGDPNGTGHNVIFNNGGSLTLDGGRTVGTYSQTGGILMFTNFGTLLLNTGGNVVGGGVIDLVNGSIRDLAPNVTFTITDGTIEGYGTFNFGINVTNGAAGFIQADVLGQSISLSSSGVFTNNGLMRAQNGGTLLFNGSSDVINNATIRSENGSNVHIQNRIVGGTLDNTGFTGTLTLNPGTLRDVTIAAGSTVTSPSGRLENTLNNLGTLSATNGSIQIASNTALSGGGTIALSGSGEIRDNPPNTTLTNTDNLVRGAGAINFSLNVINSLAGIIQADVLGQVLSLGSSGVFTNNGLMRAMNGGTLRFNGSSDVINNATIRSENGSDVHIQNRIVGGTLDNTGSTGTLTLNPGTLRDVTIAANSTVTSPSGRLESTLVNLGTLSTAGGSIQIASNTVLSGSGTIALSGGEIRDNPPNTTLTNTNNIVRGNGAINFSLNVINNAAGVIQADVSGQILSLGSSGVFTNNGLMRALNGGTLRFNGAANVINNATIRSENGSNVDIQNRIVGGTLDNTGSTGALTLSTGTLRDVTIAAGSTVVSQSGHLENTLNNLGTLSSAGGSTQIVSNTALSGGGTVALSGGEIRDNPPGTILTNTDNIVRGRGSINFSLNLTNSAAGVIQADVAGQTLSINSSGIVTNNGLFAARNGGTLSRSTGTFTNFSGSTLTGGAYLAADATLNLNIAPIIFNAATVVLSGPTSVFSAINSIGQNDGTFVITNGRTFGATPLQAGRPKTPAGTVFPNAGTLIIGPNDSTLTITGDYSQGSGSVLEIVLGGDYPNANFHHMNVTGSASLAGTLEVKLANGYVPGPGQIEIIRAGAINGGFVTVNGATVTYTSTGVFINATGNTNALQMTKAVSRKTHGLAGALDIDLPLTGPAGVECRNSGGNHTLVFTFSNNMVSGNASWASGTGTVSGSPTFAGKTMTVNLTGVADVQQVTVTLSGLMDVYSQALPNQTVSMKALVGDTTGNSTVNVGDIGQTKGQAGAVVTQANCRQDVTPNGSINAADIGLVKSRSGQTIP